MESYIEFEGRKFTPKEYEDFLFRRYAERDRKQAISEIEDKILVFKVKLKNTLELADIYKKNIETLENILATRLAEQPENAEETAQAEEIAQQ